MSNNPVKHAYVKRRHARVYLLESPAVPAEEGNKEPDRKQAQKDAHKLVAAGLKDKALPLLAVLTNDPFQNPPPYEKLVGDYSRRINIQHRLIYQVLSGQKQVKVLRL